MVSTKEIELITSFLKFYPTQNKEFNFQISSYASSLTEILMTTFLLIICLIILMLLNISFHSAGLLFFNQS